MNSIHTLVNKFESSYSDLSTTLNDLVHQEAVLQRLENKISLERKKLEEEKKLFEKQRQIAIKKYHLPSDIVELNVGGEYFTTLKSTLTQFPTTMLSSMFSGHHPLSTDWDGRFFLDRDPSSFRFILNCLRNRNVSWPKIISEKKYLQNELEYFGLDSVALSNFCVFICGGTNQNGFLSSVECYQIVNQKWINCPDMPVPRSSFSSIIYNNYLYIIGGENNIDNALASIQMLNLSFITNENTYPSWEKLPDMPSSRCGLGTALLEREYGDLLLIIGGEDSNGDLLSSIDAYNFNDKSWIQNYNRLPYPCSDMSITVCNNNIYIFGGTRHNNNTPCITNNVLVYDDISKKFNQLCSMNTARTAPSSVLYHSHIYVIGGYDYQYKPLDNVEKYSILMNEWYPVSPMQTSRAGLMSFTFSGQIFVFGGCVENREFENTIEVYNEAISTWSIYSSMKNHRENASISTLCNNF